MNISGVSTAGSFYEPLARSERAGAASRTAEASAQGAAAPQLTPDEQAQVRKLQARDREVRAHEAAHVAAGAGLASGASFTYQRGPDGVNYAIGGEVRISTSPGRTPEETIEKARQIQAAALAPADPSGQDRAVAAAAAAMAQEAQAELAQAKTEEAEGAGTAGSASAAGTSGAADTPESSAVAGAYGGNAARIGKRLDVYA